MAPVVASSVGGCAQAREGEKAEEGRGTGESERGPGAAWRRLVHQGGARQAGREEVEASGALASTRLCLLAEVEDGGELAGPQPQCCARRGARWAAGKSR